MPEKVAVKVVARCRPLTQAEVSKGVKAVVKISGDKVSVEAAGKEQTFSFDGAYHPEVKNGQIYKEKCEPLLQKALDGYNASILALGATDAGKSYLMVGTEDDPGIIPLMNQNLFKQVNERSNKEFFITVSYLEVMDDNMTDLLNPHSNSMAIRQHPQKGIYVDGLSEMMVQSGDELVSLFEQGNRARRTGASDMRAHRARSHAFFNISVEQRERQSSKVGVRSLICLADLAGFEPGDNSPSAVAGTQTLLKVLEALGDPKSKSGHVPYRDSKVTRLLQDSLGGNAVTMVFAVVSPVDKAYQKTIQTLEHGQFARAIKNQVKLNLDDTNDIIADLRDEIAKLRDKIAMDADPNRDDVNKLEDLIKDLQIAKKQTWEEKMKTSHRYQEERKVNLANKGLLEWVFDSMHKGNKEMQEKRILLQKEKDQLSAQYKEKRKEVEALRDDLKRRIDDYSKFIEKGKKSESETKAKLTAINEVKERVKKETEVLRQIKMDVKDVTDRLKEQIEDAQAQMIALKGNTELRQKVEQEERLRMEQEHKALVSEELEKSKMEVDAAKAEIQLRSAEGRQYSSQEGAGLEVKVAEFEADRAVLALQLQLLKQEKEHLTRQLEGVYQLHRDELEIQQLQHYQTFRSYREMFEEQKVALEQRYRQLIEDSIQDAIFLASRNSEIALENQTLRTQVATLKDSIVNLGGQIPDLAGPKV